MKITLKQKIKQSYEETVNSWNDSLIYNIRECKLNSV